MSRQILLDFQLHVHRKFLEPFVQLFRQFDTLHSGLLSYDQFYKLVQLMNPSHTDRAIRDLIAQADPFHQNLISFSDCVTVLADDLKTLAIQHHKQQQMNSVDKNEYLHGGAPQSLSHSAFSTPHQQSASFVHMPSQIYGNGQSLEPTPRQPFNVHG